MFNPKSTWLPSRSITISIDSHRERSPPPIVAADSRRLRSCQQAEEDRSVLPTPLRLRLLPAASPPPAPVSSQPSTTGGRRLGLSRPAGEWGSGNRWRRSCNGCRLGVNWTGSQVETKGHFCHLTIDPFPKSIKGPALLVSIQTAQSFYFCGW